MVGSKTKTPFAFLPLLIASLLVSLSSFASVASVALLRIFCVACFGCVEKVCNDLSFALGGK